MGARSGISRGVECGGEGGGGRGGAGGGEMEGCESFFRSLKP